METLFLPGHACTSQTWKSVHGAIAAHHSVTLVDWPHAATATFHSLGSFAAWLDSSFDIERFGCIVGHSLGGLAALEWLSSCERTPSLLILVESFVLPPPPFFRNLLLHEDGPAARAIQRMLRNEKSFYSLALPERLRTMDMTGPLMRISSRIHALYGDRGCGRPAEVEAELRWPEALAARIQLSIIPNACHFPMVENPTATTQALLRILG